MRAVFEKKIRLRFNSTRDEVDCLLIFTACYSVAITIAKLTFSNSAVNLQHGEAT